MQLHNKLKKEDFDTTKLPQNLAEGVDADYLLERQRVSGLISLAVFNQFKVNFANALGAVIPTLEGENIKLQVDGLITEFISVANVVASLPSLATGMLF